MSRQPIQAGEADMGERAHRAYREAEREEFRSLPWHRRLLANLAAALVVLCAAVAIIALAFGPGIFQ